MRAAAAGPVALSAPYRWQPIAVKARVQRSQPDTSVAKTNYTARTVKANPLQQVRG